MFDILSFKGSFASDNPFTLPKFNIAPWKMMVGRLLSFWDGIFSGAMLNFQGVRGVFSLRKGFYTNHCVDGVSLAQPMMLGGLWDAWSWGNCGTFPSPALAAWNWRLLGGQKKHRKVWENIPKLPVLFSEVFWICLKCFLIYVVIDMYVLACRHIYTNVYTCS